MSEQQWNHEIFPQVSHSLLASHHFSFYIIIPKTFSSKLPHVTAPATRQVLLSKAGTKQRTLPCFVCIGKPYFAITLYFSWVEQNGQNIYSPWKSSEHACHFAAGCWAASGMAARAPGCIPPTPVCTFKAMEHRNHHPNNSQLSTCTVIYFPAVKWGSFLKADTVSG